ncbi:hypothetical protein [Wolbachia endosymbiont of Ctenocephalides felis wCfeJ]|uniref:hypothetical protein n=1 Tax=Wolbachia endosymbiont of Ctenocephalides felis wCfeJ TaxID=2732594 RepID=UPI001444C6F0|nr:hypothetical protein [Wolbachia endosymbiont of Ctenocephalides felis wCfeJ]WCR57614.1 MAG: hypothetical protein PG980_000086 [Wolbachia endosymbiont of Ctenocephalides felis wCfeJ]
MKNVGLKFLLILFLVFSFSYQGYADCSWWNIKSNTWWEAIVGGKWVKEIKVKAIKDQGVNGYFNPKIEVCAYDGKSYCYELHSGTSCQKIYGTQSSGAGVSAAVFVDWEGTKEGDKMKNGLNWEWAEGVTKEEQEKFANSPKVCACSQKIACADSATKLFAGASYVSINECDTCYQTTVKCAPVPLAPGPPPFCEQLAMSPPQVRIVPIRDQENDYFNPRIRVIIGNLTRDLYFQEASHTIEDGKGTTYYFETYRKKDQLCAEYRGTEREESKRKLQFPARCFPAPSAPEIEIVKIVDENTLEVKIKMSEEVCRNYRYYNNGLCTLDISINHSTSIGPLSLKVVKPAIIKKTSIDQNDKVLEKILNHVPPFSILEQHGYAPSITAECKAFDEQGQCRLDNLGRPEIEAKYKEKPKSKMLCISGWQPEPEESILKRESEIIPLKSMGTKYIEYNSVYSKESNQFHYLPSKDTEKADPLQRTQKELDDMIFNKQGYVFFPDKNRQEKGKCSYCVERDNEVKGAFESGTGLKVVYKLTDVEQYLNKNNNSQFDLEYEEVDCRNEKGETLTDEEGKIRKCTKLKDQLIKANKTEVFYADKLCKLNLEDIAKKVSKVIKTRLTNKNLSQSYTFSDDNHYTDDLSIYDDVEIEAWGGGEAGHIKNIAFSTANRPGMPGDYIKAKLKIDPNYPIISIEVKQGGGNREQSDSDKNGGSTTIKMCKSNKQDCQPPITVAGGGTTDKTIIHNQGLKLEEEKIIESKILRLTGDNQITYIENGEIKHEGVQCSNSSSNKPGAGGCIDKNSGTYGKGAPGYVTIRPTKVDDEELKRIINKMDDKELKTIINTLVENPDVNDISNLIEKLHPDTIQETKDEIKLIAKLYPGIINTIKEEIGKELLGDQSEAIQESPGL